MTGMKVMDPDRSNIYLKFIVEDEFASRGTMAKIVDTRADHAGLQNVYRLYCVVAASY